MNPVVWIALCFALGACVGSFLNVVIYRVPRGMSVASPKRSFCPSCKQSIPAYRNLPIFTWLWQNGKCANCRVAIPFFYVAVELVTALLFAIVAWRHGGDAITAATVTRTLIECTVVALCVAITVIDFQFAIIPDPLTIPWLPLAVAAVAFDPELLRGRWLSVSSPGLHDLTLVMAGIGIGAFPALFLDFWRIDRSEGLVDGEPQSALPTADEEFSAFGELREFALPVFVPIGLAIAALFGADRALDFATLGTRGQATLTSLAGVGGGLAVLFVIRFVFSAIFRREAMGLGDAKFMALAGALLGIEGVGLTFLLASALGAMPAFGSLLRKLTGPTVTLLVAAALPTLLLRPLTEAVGPRGALIIGLVVPIAVMLWFFRRLRNSDVELRAIPFGPFLAVAGIGLLLAYEPVVDFLGSRISH